MNGCVYAILILCVGQFGSQCRHPSVRPRGRGLSRSGPYFSVPHTTLHTRGLHLAHPSALTMATTSAVARVHFKPAASKATELCRIRWPAFRLRVRPFLRTVELVGDYKLFHLATGRVPVGQARSAGRKSTDARTRAGIPVFRAHLP